MQLSGGHSLREMKETRIASRPRSRTSSRCTHSDRVDPRLSCFSSRRDPMPDMLPAEHGMLGPFFVH